MSRRGTEEPPFLSVGTEVSAKYRGAFCEAKVKIVKKLVKCKVTFKNDSSSTQITDDSIIKGPLRVGAHVEVKTEDGQVREAVINKVMDSSTYTVVFDDGDERTLRRTSLCLKGEKHFSESETLDNLPLTDPENFGTPVVHGSSKGKRRRRRWGTPTRVSSDEESDDETPAPKKSASKASKEKEVRKVLCVESTDKRRNWFPALPVSPSSADVKLTRGKDQIAVRSFRDGKYHVVNKEDTREFNKEQAERIESPSLKPAIDLAIKYLDTGDVPTSWDNNKKRVKEESDAEEDNDGEEEDEESSDEDSEEKEKFLEDLYRFMEEKGTPITKPPVLGYRDLNLFKLYELVQGQGGFDEVTKDCGLWKELYGKMGIPAQHSAASHNIKAAYKKYLHDYEEHKKKQKQQGTPRARGRPPKSPRGADRSENKEEDRKDKKEEEKKKQDKREEDKKKKKEDSDDEGDEEKDPEEEARPRRGRRPSSARRLPVPEKKEDKDKGREPEKAAEKGSKPKEKDKDSKASSKSDDESEEEEDEAETKDQKKEEEASDDEEKQPLGDYAIGDKIRVKYGRGRQQRIYEAKVLEAEMEEGELMYYVHYAGWNVRYDEWINLDRIVGPLDNKSGNKGGKKGEPVHSAKNGKTPPPNKGLGKRGRPPGSGRKKEEDDKDEKESTTSEPAPPTPEPPKTQLKKTDKTVQVKVERLSEKMESPRVARLTRSNSTADATLPFDIEALKPKRTRRSSGQSVTEPQPSEPPSSPEQIAEEEEREDHFKVAAKEKEEKTTVQEKPKEEKPSTEGVSAEDEKPPVEEEKVDDKKDAVKEEAETKEALLKEGDKDADMEREDSKEGKKEQSKNKRRESSARRKRRESVEKAPPEIEDTRQEDETAKELDDNDRVTQEGEEKEAKEQEMILAGGDSQKLPATQNDAKEQPSKDEKKEDPDKQEMPHEEKEEGDVEKTEKGKKKSAKKGKGRKSGTDQRSKAAEERRHTKEEPSQSSEHIKEEDLKDTVQPKNEDHTKEGSSLLPEAPNSVALPVKEERSSEETSKEEAQVNRISPPEPVSSAPTVTPNSTRSKRASSPTDTAFTPPSKKTKGKNDKSDRSLARSDRSSPVPESKSRRGKADKVGRTSPRQDRSSPVPSSGSSKKTKKEKVEKEKVDRISPVLQALPSVADAVKSDQEKQVPEKALKKEPEDNRTPPVLNGLPPTPPGIAPPSIPATSVPEEKSEPPTLEEALPPGGQEESKSTKNDMDMNLELDNVSEQPGVGNESPVQDSSTASSSSIGSGNMPTNGSTSASGTEAVTPSRKRKHEDADSAGSKRKRKHHRHKKGRHHKHNNVNCSDSESSEKDNKDSHHKHNGSSPRKRSRSPSDPTSPSRPPKFHFSVEECLRYQGEARIDFLQTKLQEMKTIYGALKSEVASIDRKKKRHKRKERERAEREAAQALASAAHKNNSGNVSSVSSPSTVSVECR